MEIKISVIVPVYNTGNYLEGMLNSIQKQTMEDYEVLLMDDGSEDCSSDICRAFSNTDARFCYYYHKNSGVSETRNRALKYVRGKYLLFLDSDDYIELDMFEKLYTEMEKKAVDMVICGYYMEIAEKNNKVQQYLYKMEQSQLILGRDDSEAMRQLWEKGLMYNIWNRLMRTEIIKEQKLKFPMLNMGEDLEFNLNYLKVCQTISVIPECLYHYIRERKDSATSNKYIETWFEIRTEEQIRLKKHFAELGYCSLEIREFLDRRYIERVIGCIENEFHKTHRICIKKRYQNIKKMVSHLEVRKALLNMKPHSKLIAVISGEMRKKHYIRVYMAGWCASVIRNKMPGLFMFLKVKR